MAHRTKWDFRIRVVIKFGKFALGSIRFPRLLSRSMIFADTLMTSDNISLEQQLLKYSVIGWD